MAALFAAQETQFTVSGHKFSLQKGKKFLIDLILRFTRRLSFGHI